MGCEGPGGLSRLSPARGSVACGGRGWLLGKKSNLTVPLGKGASPRLPGSSALCSNFGVWQGLVTGVYSGSGSEGGL